MTSRRFGNVDVVAGDDDQAVCIDKVAKIGRRQREDAAAVRQVVGDNVAVDRVEEIGSNGVDIWAQIFIDWVKQKMNSQ